MKILLICLVLQVVALRSQGVNHHHNLPENQEARDLFDKADTNHDTTLSHSELHEVFLEFDLNNDTNVTGDEFLQDWEQRKLGDSMEAMILFHNLDVNRDGHINEAIDLPYIVRFFDHYGNGTISEASFVTQWIKMMNTHSG